MREMSLAGFIAHLAAMEIDVHHETQRALERAAIVVETEAKAEIGHYQDAAGPFAAWEQLHDITLNGGWLPDGHYVIGKIPLGYATEEDHKPLLRDGTMRASIEHTVHMTGITSGEADIGSNYDIAVYQELGTPELQPRSFLGGAAVRKGHEVAEICGAGVVTALVGKQVAGSLMVLRQ